jgi:hypothetical protein
VALSKRATLQVASVVSATVMVAGTILAVPSKLVPPIVRAVCKAVAVAALPLTEPTIVCPKVATPVLELKVRLALVLGSKSPLAATQKPRKQVASVASLATTMVVGTIEAEPLNDTPPISLAVCSTVAVPALPVIEPAIVCPKVATPVELLKVRLALVLGNKLPVAAVQNPKKQLASVASSATTIVVGVIAAVPSKLTPPIARAVCKAVAVAAFPFTDPTMV